jgi:hypothetical protein
MESWRKVWRDGLAPLASTGQLEALRDALAGDDPRLLQGATTNPPPLLCLEDRPVEAACAVGIMGVEACGGWGEATVGAVEEVFVGLCHEIDKRVGEPAGCHWFLNWADETPRDEMRRELLAEVSRELAGRGANPAA